MPWGVDPTGGRILEDYTPLMNIIVFLIVLMLVFGGGGFYLGGSVVGGIGFGAVFLLSLVLLLQKRSQEIRHLNRFRFIKNL